MVLKDVLLLYEASTLGILNEKIQADVDLLKYFKE
jgi:hypothetical protein